MAAAVARAQRQRRRAAFPRAWRAYYTLKRELEENQAFAFWARQAGVYEELQRLLEGLRRSLAAVEDTYETEIGEWQAEAYDPRDLEG